MQTTESIEEGLEDVLAHVKGDKCRAKIVRPRSESLDEDLAPIDEFHKHQVLHLSSVVGRLVETEIVEHRYVQSDPELLEAAQAVSQTLADFYQLVGSKTL